jgi:hypothetical protein
MSSEETKAPAAASEDKKEAETGANKVTDVAVNDANNASSNVAADDVEIVADEEHEDPLVIDEAEEKSDGADSDEKVKTSPILTRTSVSTK